MYPTVTVPSPALIDEMCGAEGSPGRTVIVRVTVLATEKTESPAWVTSMVHSPMERMLTIPLLEMEHTEPPEVTDDVTGRPLEAEAFRTKSGSPSS